MYWIGIYLDFLRGFYEEENGEQEALVGNVGTGACLWNDGCRVR